MKRDKKTYPLIKKINPIFWKECRFCEREFRREKGFKIEDYTKINPTLYFSYCCTDCCDSIEDVKDRLKSSDIRHQKELRDRALFPFNERKGVSTSQLVTFMYDTRDFDSQLKECKCGGIPNFNGWSGMRGQIKCSKCDLTIGGMSSSENLKSLWNSKYSK